MNEDRTIGTCSICGGAVTVPGVWWGICPPTPTCTGCGAVAASHGPVIPMVPAPRQFATITYEPYFVGTPEPSTGTVTITAAGEDAERASGLLTYTAGGAS